MNWKGRLSALGFLAAAAAPATAQVFQQPACVPPPPACATPGTPVMPGTPITPGMPPVPGMPGVQPAPGAGDAFASAPEGGTLSAASYNPTMFGDQLGTASSGSSSLVPVPFPFILLRNGVQTPLAAGQTFTPQSGDQFADFRNPTHFLPIPASNFGVLQTIQPAFTSSSSSNSSSNSARVGTAVALLSHGAFKIAENESPLPMDRVFVNYNHFDKVLGSVSLDRETVGFEKTFLDGNASVGLRVPVFQLGGDSTDGIGADSGVGDLTLIVKYALIHSQDTGNVLSTGLALTLPTGPNLGFPGVHDTLIQPYVGAIYNMDRLYVHGFMSVAIPTDSQDTLELFTDAGVGYKLYQADGGSGRLLTSIIPTFEFHLNDPLTKRGVTATPFGFDDVLDLTYGVTFGLGQRSTLGLAIVTPVTGPKPFDVEAQVQFNWRF